jgi:uncharacterized membrane protein YgcG
VGYPDAVKHGRSRAATRRAIISLLAGLLLLTLLSALASAAAPPYPERPRGVHLVDDAELINRLPEQGLNVGLEAYQDRSGVDIAIFIQTKPAANERAEADTDAQALLEEWQVGGSDGMGLAMVWEMDREATRAVTGIAVGSGLAALAGDLDLPDIMRTAMSDALRSDDWVEALNQGVFALTAAIPTSPSSPTPGGSTPPGPGPTPGPLVPDLPSAPAGPPYPEPIAGVTVYDYAGVLAPSTRQRAASVIAGIEERTGAEVIVYTQVKPSSDTPDEAERDAIALVDQYGVGRQGFDDGLAVLFDLDESLCHGQVQLYAAPGFRASYLTNEDRQRIFDQDMVPHLGRCDLSGALDAAMASIDTATTPQRASQLQLARQVDAATGLVLAPLALIALVGWAGWSWLRYGRDPQYLDDPSIHMPAPPPDLSPAAATVVLDGRATQHAVTTALVDEAGRGELRFRQPGSDGRASLDVLEPDTADPRVLRNRSVQEGAPERQLRERLRELRTGTGSVTAEQLTKLAPDISRFKEELEDHVVAAGWFREAPSDARDRWSFRAGIVLVIGVIAIFVATRLPSSGLLLLGGALVAASIAMFVLARVMPQRTMAGAMVNAWLAAYRRTLERTLAGARSMEEVVSSQALPWVQTPDQAVVWGFAMGLHHEVEDVLERSVELARENEQVGGRAPWVPAWYVPGTGSGSSGVHAGSSGGMFSSSTIPNFGAMTAALSTIGVAASSSSGSGGSSGGFSGGSSGGGGGGAGGGF